MRIDEVREYFLDKPGVVEEMPFNIPVPVFKLEGKIFALINCHQSDRASINLKYYKEVIESLREAYEEVKPGYHMNKSHWNTVYLDGKLEDRFIKDLIDISYELVFKTLTAKKQKEIRSIGITK